MKNSYIIYMNKLTGEYKEVFSDIETFGWTVEIDSILFEEKMSELLDVFINAQEEGRDIESIVGDDVNTFCSNFFDEIPKMSMIRDFFDSIKRVAWCILIIDIIDILICISTKEESVSDIGGLLFLFFGSYVLSRLLVMGVRKLLYRKVSMSYKKRRTVILAADIILIILLVFIAFNFIDDLLIVPSTVVVPVSAVYLVLYYLVNHNRIKSDRKERAKESFSDRMADELAPTMQKKFEKKNARLIKKGKTPYTWHEFVENENKMTDKLPKIARLYLIFPIIIILIMLGIMIPTDSFESSADIFIFIGIMLIVEYAIMYMFYRIEMNSYKLRLKWGEEQRNK